MLGFGVRLWEGRLRSRGGFFPGATLDMNFANATYLGAKPSDLTVVRASVAYGTNADGSLTRFGVNVPRITALGLLIEAARTNSALQSQTLDNASWTRTSLTVTADTAVAPDGTSTADTLTATGDNGTLKQGVGTTAVSWANSVWLKRKTGSGNVDITMDGTNWVTQTINSSTWTRCSVVQTGVAGTSNPGVRLVMSGDEVYAWGEQAEAGGYPTSYIPTVGATVTRAADDIILAGAAFASVCSTAIGAWYVEGTSVNNAGGAQTRRFAEVNDGTASNRILLGLFTNNQTRYLVSSGGAGVADIFSAAAFSAVPVKLAARCNTNDFQQATWGVLGTPDVAGALPAVSQITLGCDVAKTALAYIDGPLARLAYVPGVPTDATIMSMSS